MAHPASAGAVYSIDTGNGRPSHYWIVLNDLEANGEFIVVSWTDARNLRSSSMPWPAGHRITASMRLSKESALHVALSRVETQAWLNQLGAVYLGLSVGRVLDDARCVLCFESDKLRPSVEVLFRVYQQSWCSDCP